MPKRQRVDDASQDLIDSLRESDDLEHALKGFKDERVSIDVAFSDIHEKLKSEFKTEDPKTLSKRNQLRFKQKLEYEQGLKDDRIRELDLKVAAYKQEHEKRVQQRKKRRLGERKNREVDDKISECNDIAQKHCKDCDWKTIGKTKHIQMSLNSKISTMSEEQKEQYSAVLKELKDKGWRVLEHKHSI